jgi:hypothetical protein
VELLLSQVAASVYSKDRQHGVDGVLEERVLLV